MVTLLIILSSLFAVCLVVHVIYDNVVLPLLLKKYKFKLFEIRDKLRDLQISNADDTLKPVFHCLQVSINNMIVYSQSIDGFLLFKFRQAYKNSEKLRKRVSENIELLDNCGSKEIHSIDEQLNDTFRSILIINSGSLFFYIFPIFLIMFILDKISEWIKKSMYIPEEDMVKISPAV